MAAANALASLRAALDSTRAAAGSFSQSQAENARAIAREVLALVPDRVEDARGAPLRTAGATALTLGSLPSELIVRIIYWLPSPYDIGRVACVSTMFYYTGLPSLVEQALRQRLWQRAEHYDQLNMPLPSTGTSCVQYLLWVERRDAPRASISAGSLTSAFVDVQGRLLTCGTELVIGQTELVISGDEDVGERRPGLLGLGDDVRPIQPPTHVHAFENDRVRAVSAGEEHTLVLVESGQVYSFGSGHFGQLGHGDDTDCTTPRLITSLSETFASAISAGSAHSLVIAAGGVYSFGDGDQGVLGHGNEKDQLLPKLITLESWNMMGTRIHAVSAGGSHSLLICESGGVYSFGYGENGQLGHGDTNNQLVPTRIAPAALNGERARAVSAGPAASFVLTDSGSAYSFGHGYAGRLGHGNERNLCTPKQIAAFIGRRVTSISSGGAHSLALTDDGHVYAFGEGGDGRLGVADKRRIQLLAPRRIPLFLGETVVDVSAGFCCGSGVMAPCHSLFALSDGRVLGCGTSNFLGQPTMPGTPMEHGDLHFQLLPRVDDWPKEAFPHFLSRPTELSPNLRVRVHH